MERRLLSVPEASIILGVQCARCYQMARDGIIPTVRLGRQIRIDSAKLYELIDRGGQPLPGGWRREA